MKDEYCEKNRYRPLLHDLVVRPGHPVLAGSTTNNNAFSPLRLPAPKTTPRSLSSNKTAQRENSPTPLRYFFQQTVKSSNEN
ncbi:MAG: hypothetical protein RQ899_14475 [Pseudomonadales bacterium]|nr:hypothetical protein [Pseudomonadales bacterium]